MILVLLLLTSFSTVDAQSHRHVTSILETSTCAQQYAHAITPYEWRELEMDTYIKRFDRTHTCCGPWGLQQLTWPITDHQALLKRQQGLLFLEQSPEQLYQWYRLLHALAGDQQHLLAYYNEHDQLANRTKQLYFSWFGWLFNKSQAFLDCAYFSDVCNSAITLIGLLSINSLCAELACSQMEGRSINIVQGALGGFSHLINAHRLNDNAYQQFKQADEFACATLTSFSEQSSHSVARIYNAIAHTLTSAVTSAAQLFSKPASTQTIFKGTFGDKWSFYHEQCHIPRYVAACLVAGNLLYIDQCLIVRINQHYRKLRSLFYTYRSLQHRLVGVARFMRHAVELLHYAQTIDALAENNIIQEAYALCTSVSSDLASVMTHLRSSHYDQEQQMWYSRGHALITHALVGQHTQQILRVLQAVGVIDAYISIYRVYDEYRQGPNSFCFADLALDTDVQCIFKNAWLPLTSAPTEQHSCIIGLDQPRNMLLTGPNGSGKSYFLKLVGGLAVLAQSWTIVPAASCRVSVFSAIRTSFDPREDVTCGVSTFMAQKERLDALNKLIESEQHGCSCMVLVDEPYRGTIEAEAEHRCYQWCNNIARFAHCMQLIACHLKKPLELAHSGCFAIKQLEVLVHDDFTFTRTFKLKDGAPAWWFDDVAKRMAFVDSL